MSTITLPNIRVSSDLQVRVRLKDGGVAIDWSTLSNIKACIYSDAQRALAGRCGFTIDEEDNTLLVCNYAANKPQYLGVNRIVISAKYMGETKTYDKPAFNFVRWTDDQEGQTITIDDPDIDVEISVEDISSSILQEAVDAAFTAADRANDAAAAAEHMVDIHTGPQGEDGKSAYQCAVDEGYIGTEEEWLASLKGTDGADGDPAGFGTVSASVGANTGTPSVTVTTSGPDTAKNITFAFDNLKGATGETGATPAFSIGTVTTGAAGSQAAATITGTAAAPILNLTIPQGDQGNTGSSVDYAYELVNNLTTNDATKGLSAAQGVVLAGEVSQLEREVDGASIDYDDGVLLSPTDGNPQADADLCVSEFVPVATNDIVTTHPGFSSENVNAYLLGYDSSKQYVSGQYWAVARAQDLPERNITIANASVKYVRMVFSRDASEAFVKVNTNKTWEYHKAKMGMSEYGITKIGGEKPLYQAGQYAGWMSGYVHDGTGEQTSSTVNECTGFIEIDGYDAVDVLMNYPQGVTRAGVCFYKADGTFIMGYAPRSGAPSSGLTEKRMLNIPGNAKYARFSIRNASVASWFLVGIKKPKIQLSSLLKKQKVTMEFGNLDANGQMKPYASDFFDNARTPLYYKLQSINLPYSYNIYVYESDYSLVETISAQANTDYELDPAKWHKIVINYTANSLSVKEIVIDLEVLERSYNVISPKTIKTFQYLVKYKKGRGLYEDGDSDYSEAYNMADDLISNTLRFYLPTNYSPTGEPVKLIYKAHGSNGYSWIDLDTWGGDSSIDYLADEGFALYDMFAGTSYYQAIINPTLTHDSSQRIANYNVPIQLAAQVAAYEWIVSHFNVDKRVYVFGKSHGGMAGIYATNKIVPTRAVALFAPLITPIGDLYQPWGNHSNECSMCLDDMCFIPPVGMTFDQMVTAVNTKASGWKDILLANIRQQSGLNAYINGVTNIKQAALLSSLMDDDYKVVGGMDDVIRHSETPVKIWCAPDDAEVVFANGWNFIKSLQNGGSNAQFREFPTGTGGHYFDSFTDASSIKDTVTTALGVQYTAPRAYIEAVNFFHQF